MNDYDFLGQRLLLWLRMSFWIVKLNDLSFESDVRVFLIMPMLSLLFLTFKVDKTNNSLFSPGNLYWEELYNAIDNPYVILTVRDDEHVWLNSWKNFARVFYNNGGVFSRRIMTFIMQSGMCGYRNRRFVSLGKSNSFKSITDSNKRCFDYSILSCTLSSSFARFIIRINWWIANIDFTDRGCWCASWKRPEAEIHWTQSTCYGNLRF